MKRFLLICLTVLSCSAPLWAHDFSDNSTGTTFYYNIVGDDMVEIAPNGTNVNSYTTASIEIPKTVVYNETNYTVVGIGERAFYSCSSVTSISVPDDITYFGSNAFNTCRNLATINAPSSLVLIDEYAFYMCQKLESFSIPSSVTSIGKYAFYQCYLIEDIVVPDGVTEIGERTFYQCTGLTSVEIGSGVKSIGNYAFYGCTALGEITIPDNVETMADRVFQGCNGLEAVVFGDGLTSIGEYFFYQDAKLSEVVFGKSMETLGSYSFYGCVALAEVELPNTLSSVGTSVFASCSGLTSVKLGTGLTTLGTSMFRDCSSLKEITIPAEVSSISNNAFNGCTSLSSITSLNPIPPTCGTNVFSSVDTSNCVLYVPEGSKDVYAERDTWKDFKNITEILSETGDVFEDGSIYYSILSSSTVEVTWGGESYDSGTDTYIGAITIPSTTKYGGITYDVIGIGANAFRNCEGLTSVNIPQSVTYVDTNAFLGTTKMTTIDLGYGVQTIGIYAFRESGLTEITIPNNVTIIEPYAFNECASLTSVSIGNGLTTISEGLFGEAGLESITIPNSIASIDQYAFQNCKNLATIDFGTGVTSIGNYAFSGAGLTEITIPDNVTSFGQYTFSSCMDLKKATINATGVVDQYAFFASSIEELVIGPNITDIKSYAFSKCESLLAVNIPNNVLSIGAYSFENCKAMETLSLGSGLTSVSAYAFQYCERLASLTIPDNITTLGAHAFHYCYALKELNIGSGVTSTDIYTFAECTSLEEVTIPSTLTSMGRNTFYKCSGLKNVTIEEGVESLGSSSFQDCTSLEKITLPSSLGKITSSSSFQGCTSLTEVTINEGITQIGGSMFEGCTSLPEITLPSTSTLVASAAFKNCSSLAKVTSLATTPPSCTTGDNFEGILSTCVLYVPARALEDYKTADTWADFYDIEPIDSAEEPGTFTCVVSPESGSDVDELYNNITFYNPTEGGAIYVNDYCAEVIEVYSEDETFVTRQAQFYTEFGPDGEDYSQTVFFEDRVSEEGTYYVNVPAELFIVYDENGKTCYNEAMTLTYTITADSGDQEPNYELVFYPEDGSTLDLLSTISISCEDGITRVLLPDEQITIVDSEGNDYGYSVVEVGDDTGFVTEVDIILATEIVDAGTYYVNVPAGYFDIGQSMNKTFSLTYYITGTMMGINGISIDSDNVEGIYSTSGQKLNTTIKGVNIIRYNDGKTKKVLIK